MSSCSTSPSTADHGSESTTTTISVVHQDIIQTHILTRLDGLTLAAAACSSSQLHALSTQDELWKNICASTWPSINDPRVSQVISTFPSGHRSFFSDSFPVLDHRRPSKDGSGCCSVIATELISCVDIYYKDVLILSKTQEMETVTGWFLCSPFRVDLLDPKESVSTPIINGGEEDDTWLEDFEENLRMSWILIDPERKRAVNLSSRRAVSVERHWLTGDVQARFSLIMEGDQRSGMELVKWEVVVTCGGGDDKEGMQVREVSMQVEDMNGKGLSGRDSLVILQEAVEKGKRKRGTGNEGKVRYREFVERKRDIKLRRIRREQVLDMACIVVGISAFVSLWCFILFR